MSDREDDIEEVKKRISAAEFELKAARQAHPQVSPVAHEQP